ncbi:prolyl oligopeptidase family serine peptidase [Gordonia sp. zg691]|uniref:Prolyl oligopeptidase family serine peptidase n=1 Tax=Gordonia jinghuaiqii TaxID=2758710 RepID=A0A7D7LZI9_9ACTN|nr:prolyl oligopeptidase family serine peptidase [Gordonia jinghuaiqii]MCR5978968.1 prolyl oligopeptidase family serine peptidase [Gordonia jinghuaiqii]QMT03659.1 prolyl oligopeptidase family serine peptidase [Gordonia jinghuaiqii]
MAAVGLGVVGFGAVGFGAVACSDEPSSTTSAPASSITEQVETLDEVTVHRFEYPTPDTADTEQNWAELYLPAGEQRVDSIPLVVLIHGGAWQSALGADIFEPLARDLADRGMAVYNVEYRRVGSGGGWPATFRDVASALDHVAVVDKQFPQITTDDELVVGHSAGAQLAVWGGTRHKLKDDEVGSRPVFRPTRVVSLAGPLDMVYAATHGDDRIVTALGGTPRQVPQRYAMVDPIQNIDPDTPVVAIHGTADRVVSPVNSQRYVDAVVRQGGDAEAVLIDGGNHGSVVTSDAAEYPRVLDIITGASQADVEDVA